MRIVAISALAVLCVGCAQHVPCQFCGSQWSPSVAPTARDEGEHYQRGYDRRAPVAAEDGAKYPGEEQTQPRRVRHAANPVARRTRFTTDLSAYPPVPRHDSPAGEKERREAEQFDKNLQRALGSVCKGC